MEKKRRGNLFGNASPFAISGRSLAPLTNRTSCDLKEVTSRGDRQEAFFDADQDHTGFLNVLGNVASRFRWLLLY
jgi:hypothetical protein